MQIPTHANKTIEGTRVTLEEVCLNGHAFAVIVGSFGSTMVQIYEAVENTGAIPQPKRCDIEVKKKKNKSLPFFLGESRHKQGRGSCSPRIIIRNKPPLLG